LTNVRQINNHLIFFLYIHQAIWGKKAPQYLPRGIRLNGHAMLNGDKMSKSTGKPRYISDRLSTHCNDYVLSQRIVYNQANTSNLTGNFLTLDAAVQKFSADATRVALADAGDSVEDANFEETVANSTILKLFELRKWMEEVIFEARLLKDSETWAEVRESEKIRNGDIIQRSGKKGFWDELFENEMNILVKETIQHYAS
jgi:leucyl-tRNA synthetase